jgi:hypothetical protein
VLNRVRIARLFAQGGEQARLADPAEQEHVAAYLAAGAPILMTTVLTTDRLDPSRGNVVGASYRTDGTWVWSDALTYYVRVHGLAPEDAFLEWIRVRGYACPAPDDSAQDAALDALYVSFRS